MPLKQSEIYKALKGCESFRDDKLHIVPFKEAEAIKNSGSSSVDLRLGRWFLGLRQTQLSKLNVSEEEEEDFSEAQLTSRTFVGFGKEFILHPHTFVLGATLEWIKIPKQCAGTIVGKSSWGRRGLIIETAPSVHPAFSGCLTLELTNVGEVPIPLLPGMKICQLVLHRAEGDGETSSSFDGLRRPVLGKISLDSIAQKLKQTG